jgi:hypothetical protein
MLSKNVKIKIYRAIVLYGLETWSLKLREENMSKVFEKRALMRLFGPKMDDMIADWEKLHNEALTVYRVSRTPWTGDQPVGRTLPTHTTTQTQNKRRQLSMS